MTLPENAEPPQVVPPSPGSAPDAASPRGRPEGHADFLAATLPRQTRGIAAHRLGEERVWLKKAGPRHSPMRYRLLALMARVFRLDVLTPVPNLGGEAAIATEARRLRQLARAGVRVPRVLAEQPG
ncbi:MAG: hypothetical protein QM586_11120, partial [Xenophilus sp.]